MSTEAGGGAKTRVLIADDEPTIAETLRIILEQEGFEAATANCGSSAVEKARCWHPDVFLSDLLMPEMDGIEAAMRICDQMPECRVLLLTGIADGTAQIQAARRQGYEFALVTKPVHPRRLLQLLGRLKPGRDGSPVSDGEAD